MHCNHTHKKIGVN